MQKYQITNYPNLYKIICILTVWLVLVGWFYALIFTAFDHAILPIFGWIFATKWIYMKLKMLYPYRKRLPQKITRTMSREEWEKFVEWQDRLNNE